MREIEGNKLVDREAKEVAKGRISDMKLLPCYLRKPVLTNSSAVKRAHTESLTKEWQEAWRNSKQGKALTLLDKSTPLRKFLKSLSNPKLSRTVASVVTQLRLTHFLLNRYLKRIGRVDNTRCLACGKDNEDINHFLLRCQNYAHERWPLT
jgi:hypothetical protein